MLVRGMRMNNSISKNVLKEANRVIEEKFGIYFPEERGKDLIRSISNAAKQKDVEIQQYIDDMISNKLSEKELEALVTFITIGETYFFRDKKLFKIMREKILPDIINSKKNHNRTLKIWSAGCSTGEEAYSIAILIKELIPDCENWNIKIIATDINEKFLSKAKKGIYSEWSFRGLDENFKKKYFNKIDKDQYEVKNYIAKFVKFNNLNLVRPIYLIDNEIVNNIDIVLCRNVLIYFNKYRAQKIINSFYKAVIRGGWLITAPTENLYFNNTSFIPVNINDRFLYSKSISIDRLEKVIPKKSILKDLLAENENSIHYFDLENSNYSILQNELKPISKNMKVPIKSSKKESKLDLKKLEALCRCLANKGKLQEALECCKKIIYEDKINPMNYYLLASIEEEQGNIFDAIKALKKAIYLDPDFIMAYFNLGNLNLKQQKFKEAFKNFEIASVFLKKCNEENIIPHSEETTVGTLRQVIKSIVYRGDLYGKM